MSKRNDVDYSRMCFRCHRVIEKTWSICDNCKDPIRNYDEKGQPHGYQHMKNGNREWRWHGEITRIILASDEELIYKDGILQFPSIPESSESDDESDF